MGECYEIVVKGHIDQRRAMWFEDVTVTNLPTGEAVLTARLGNDDEVAALMDRVSSLGMPLVALRWCAGESSAQNVKREK